MSRLFESRDIAGLVFFRITVGLVLALQPVYMIVKGQAEYFYVWPSVFFPHPGFGWLPPIPDQGVWIVMGVMLAGGLCIAAGFLYRVAALAYAVAWGYLFFLERINYHNQHYLIFLLAVLFLVVPAHRACSVDALWMRSVRSQTAPAWAYWILRLQIAMPYLFGAIVKLQPDWLQGRPAAFIWASSLAAHPYYDFLNPEFMALAIAWGGVFVDLTAVPLLLFRRTRALGYGMTLVFHALNLAIMGGTPLHLWMFPWILIPATTIFFEPDWPRRAWVTLRRRDWRALAAQPAKSPPAGRPPAGRLTLAQRGLAVFLGMYVLLQVALPLRHYAYPGPMIWTGEGREYAWTMILSMSFGSSIIEIHDPATGETTVHDPALVLSPHQVFVMTKKPRFMKQYAEILAERYAERGQPGIEVRFRSRVSLNGRPFQQVVDPELDLVTAPTPWGHQPWVLPLKHPLPPLEDAFKHLAGTGFENPGE